MRYDADVIITQQIYDLVLITLWDAILKYKWPHLQKTRLHYMTKPCNVISSYIYHLPLQKLNLDNYLTYW